VISKLSALAPLAGVAAADGAFYALLEVHTDLPRCRSPSADPRAQGRRDLGRVRHDGRLLLRVA